MDNYESKITKAENSVSPMYEICVGCSEGCDQGCTDLCSDSCRYDCGTTCLHECVDGCGKRALW